MGYSEEYPIQDADDWFEKGCLIPDQLGSFEKFDWLLLRCRVLA